MVMSWILGLSNIKIMPSVKMVDMGIKLTSSYNFVNETANIMFEI